MDSYFSYKNVSLVCVRGLNAESLQEGIARFPFRGFSGAFSICAFKLLDGNTEKESKTATEKLTAVCVLATTSQTSFFAVADDSKCLKTPQSCKADSSLEPTAQL